MAAKPYTLLVIFEAKPGKEIERIIDDPACIIGFYAIKYSNKVLALIVIKEKFPFIS